MADNLISVHFGLGKHAILIKNPAAIAKVRTSLRPGSQMTDCIHGRQS